MLRCSLALLLFAVVNSFAPAPVRAYDADFESLSGWDRAGSGRVEVNSPGVLTLNTTRDEVTQVFHREPVGPRYLFSFRMRVDLYGQEQGVVVYDGAHRMMLYFRSDGIAARTDTGGQKLVTWNRDTA